MNAPTCHWDTGATYAGVSLKGDMDVILRAQWDRIPWDSKSLIGFQARNDFTRSLGMTGDGMIILERNGDSYRRVGMCTWNPSQQSPDLLVQNRQSGETFEALSEIVTGQSYDGNVDCLQRSLGKRFGRVSKGQRICME
jgi:hypothetical protein